MSQDLPSLESLIQLHLARADEGQSGSPVSAQLLAFAALRFVTLYPERQKEPILTGIENLLLCKVSNHKTSNDTLEDSRCLAAQIELIALAPIFESLKSGRPISNGL